MFASKGPVLLGARETTGVQSLTLTTGYATGDVLVVWAATKATGVSGASTEVSVTDSKGNSYIRAAEYASGGTDGTRASVHYANVSAALVSGDTVSLGVTSGLSQFQGMFAAGYTITTGTKATLAASTGVSQTTAATAASGALAGLAADDYLFLSTIANRNSATRPNATGDVGLWVQAQTGTTGGAGLSGQQIIYGERILTGATGITRNISGLAAANKALVIVALKQETLPTFDVGQTMFIVL